MEILFFQLFVVATMAVARAVSPQALLVAAIVWTVFTLAMIFAAPLIILQLLVVWLSYSMLAPKAKDPAKNEKVESKPSEDIARGTEPPEAKLASGPSVYRSVLEGVVKGDLATDGIFLDTSSPKEPSAIDKRTPNSAEDTVLAALAQRANELLRELGEATPAKTHDEPPRLPRT